MSLSQTGMSLSLEHRNKKVNDIHEGKWNGLGGKFEAAKRQKSVSSAKCMRNRVYLSETRNYAARCCFPNSKATIGMSLCSQRAISVVN